MIDRLLDQLKSTSDAKHFKLLFRYTYNIHHCKQKSTFLFDFIFFVQIMSFKFFIALSVVCFRTKDPRQSISDPFSINFFVYYSFIIIDNNVFYKNLIVFNYNNKLAAPMTPAIFPRVANFNSVNLRTVGKAYLLNSFYIC